MAKSLKKMRSAKRVEPAPTHLKDLVPDPANRRAHNPRNLGMVVEALQSVGAARSIVIDEDNVILAGNGVSEAAAEAGITKVHVVDVDGSTLVAVRRRGLNEEQKRALAMYDNRTGELATWDAQQFRTDMLNGLELHPWFTEDELARIAANGEDVVTDPAKEWRNMPEFVNDPKAHKSMMIHFKTEADVVAFSELIQQPIGAKTKYVWFRALV
jgi:hypothetical protein